MRMTTGEFMLSETVISANIARIMSDPVDPSPYAQPALTSYPDGIGSVPKKIQRLSAWWLLLPVGMSGASFILLPTICSIGENYSATFNGPIAGLAASFAVACLIGSINAFRQARNSREDRDVRFAALCYGAGVAAACIGAICFFNSALMFAFFFR